MPAPRASLTEPMTTGLPPTATSPLAARTPISPSISSVRPAPTSPATPSISPRFRSNETPLTMFSTEKFVTESTTSPLGEIAFGGKRFESSRPTMACAIWSSLISPAPATATRAPSRKTVIRSAIFATSSSLCEVYRMAVPAAFRRSIWRNSTAASRLVSTAVGSSMIRTRALRDSALAISTICLSETEMSETRALGLTRVSSSDRSRSASARIAFLSRKKPRFSSRPRKMFSSTLSCSARLNSWWMRMMPWSSASSLDEKATGLPSSSSSPLVGAR